ncbi:MAG: nitrate/sulfonate/bicarbonate ABC transporter ATP-binding protein [Bryobacterales bacterium]|nr:nitrate/sulfonate/bicarbonate ABC transporter ATP-binding protein [Bryobacterales bacterium]
MASDALIELDNISHYYGARRKQFLAVQDVRLKIYEGEFVALLGPSGCGKSTLLRIVAGLTAPSEGRVLYRGRPLRGINPHATIVFQTFALFPWLTVLENVEVVLRARHVPEKLAGPRALDLLDKVGLDGFETAYPRELSGGMRQKAGFARAMAVSPELLCLDEPFSALDVLSAEALRTELTGLWTGGDLPTKAILMVTHNIEEAVYMADRIVIMEKDPGRVTADFAVGLRRPRFRKGTAFLETVDRVYTTMAGQTQPEHVELGAAPGGEGRLRLLPEVNINDIEGLMGYLVKIPGPHTDIYRLTDDLKLDSDHMLLLTEAAELLGFATIAQGDIALTTLGETFAEAGVAARKEMFALRVRRLPLIRWMLDKLREAERRQVPWNGIKTELEGEILAEEIERQMQIAVDWGRYAELLAYDDAKEMLYLEPAGAAAT